MKIIFLTITNVLLLLLCSKSSAQNISKQDTTIILDRKIAKIILEQYKNTKDLETDLMPDISKDWMVTDRPHIAETPHLTTKNHLQVEMGFNFENTRNELGVKTQEITYNTTLLRFGLSRKIEFRAEMAYLGTNISKENTILEDYKGLSGLSLGSKIHLVKAKGRFIPEITLLYDVTLPYFGSKDYKPSYTTPSIKFLFLNRITKFYEFEYNLGYQCNAQGNASYALNNEFEINQHWHFFAEIYGTFTENNQPNSIFDGSLLHDHRANTGVWYMFSPSFQLDLSGGVGLSKMAPDYYFSVGISNRFSLKK